MQATRVMIPSPAFAVGILLACLAGHSMAQVVPLGGARDRGPAQVDTAVAGVAKEAAPETQGPVEGEQRGRIEEPRGTREALNHPSGGVTLPEVSLRQRLLEMPIGPPAAHVVRPGRGQGTRPDALALAESVRDSAVLRRARGPGGAAQDLSVVRTSSDVLVRLQPGVHAVNGRIGRLRFTPGGQYVITGRGFGTAGGKVFLRGAALGQTLHLVVDAWQDDRIYASMPADVRGAADLERVLLVVAPNGGKALENGEFGFLAAREVVALARLPEGARFHGGSVAPTGQTNDTLGIHRFTRGESIVCFEPGTDRLSLAGARLGNGFEIESFDFWHGPTDAGDGAGGRTPGSRVVFGRYDAYWQGDDLMLPWAVHRTHMSPDFMLGAGLDLCSSSYHIRLHAVGPRGLAP